MNYSMSKTMAGTGSQRRQAFSVVLAFLLALALLPLVAPAQQAQAAAGDIFTVNNEEGISVTYKVLTEDAEAGIGTVQVGEGRTSAPAVAKNTSGQLSIPETVANNGITYTVESLNIYALYNCTALTAVTLPDSLASIGNEAFRGCSSLAAITVPDSVTHIGNRAFYGCSSLGAVTLSDSIESIGNEAFRNCSSLAAIIIPDSIESIGTSVFSGCASLETATVGSSVVNINSYAFNSCSALTTLIFKGAVVPELGSTTFSGLPESGTVYYPEGATSYTAESFQAAALPVGWEFVVEVGAGTDPGVGTNGAFIASNADGIPITYKVLAEDVETATGTVQVGDGSSTHLSYASKAIDASFAGSLVLPCTVTHNGITYTVASIGGWAFYGCTGLISVSIPDSVTRIDGYAFQGCSSLISLTLPDTTEYIGLLAFDSCSSLLSLTIPDNVTRILNGAFRNCTSLTSFTFGSSMESIGFSMFNNDRALTTLTFKGDLAPKLEEMPYHGGVDIVFNDLSAMGTLYYPEGAVGYEASVFRAAGLPNGWVFESVQTAPTFYTISIDSDIGDGTVTASAPEARHGASIVLTVTPDEGYRLAPGSLKVNSGAVGVAATGEGDSFTFTMPRADATITAVFEVDFGVGVGEFFTVNSSVENIPVTYLVLTEDIGARTGTVRVGGDASLSAAIATGTVGSLTLSATVAGNGITYTVEEIGEFAFNGCKNLTLVSIPDSVRSIGRQAFGNCSSLASVAIPDSVISIEDVAFQNCTILNVVSIGDSVKDIGIMAFADCTSLAAVTIPGSVTSIKQGAFMGCTSLESIAIPDTVTSLGSSVFARCTSLKSATLPNTAEDIESSMFQDCTSLEFIAIPDSVKSIGTNAFYGTTTLETVIFGSSIEAIGNSAFRGCAALSSLALPDSLINIGEHAFNGCTALFAVTIPDSVISIGASAFNGCTSLESVAIESSVTNLSGYVFYSCSALTTLTFEGDVAPTLGSMTFNGLPESGTVYYPEGATGYVAESFQAAALSAGWVFVAVPSGPAEPEVGDPGSGDLDGDGKVTASEALQVARAVVSGDGALTKAQVAAADMDGDGALTMSDVVRILRAAAGLH
ncbi:MAG: leucine-rich repeat protein [Coriobacteriales bacterium]|jgi:hypothetical protein|nr:leucine-rich repeat protein [Coriobacteriales bacterium]